jgi:BolA family transcriptional regulator, general stress-responsive regulator
MTIGESIREKITEALSPTVLDIVDDSHMHSGHAGSRPGGDSHFSVRIVAAAFAGQSRVDRQRLINGLLADEFASGLHALSLTTQTPEEADGA